MPTLVSRSTNSGSGNGNGDAHLHALPQAPSLSSLASQAAAIQHVRNRFLSTVRTPKHPFTASAAAAATTMDMDHHHHQQQHQQQQQHNLTRLHSSHLQRIGDDDDDNDNMDDALSSVSSAGTPSPIDTLETEFAAAVIFVDTYQGPHRILKMDNSTPKKEFYALYHQATVGACPLATPPVGISKLELARWEKWVALGHMPRHEAMQKYTAALDNLVDDWRRSAGLTKPAFNLSASIISTTSSGGGVPGSPLPTYPRQAKRSTNLFERLPRIYDEFGELQERVEVETRKREELEAQLVAFTHDNRALFTREIHQVDLMRTNVTRLVQSLEEDVTQHYNELQQIRQRQQQLQTLVDGSVLLQCETRLRHVYAIVANWLHHKTVRRVLLVVLAIRVWNFVRHRRMPHFLAQLLIRWITTASTLENPAATSAAGPRTVVVRR